MRKFKSSLEANSKFTIHPFRSLHSKHLLPLSPTDYIARFGLELVVVAIAIFAVCTNITLAAHTNADQTKDQSVVFSYLSQNPKLNKPLIAANETSTIVAQSDQWISTAQASSNAVVLTSSAYSKSDASPTTIQDNVIVKTNPADTSNLRHGKTSYEVQSGDNLVSIASSFGISPATIIKENNLIQGAAIKPGQDLTILPVDGISYTLKSGDSLEAIANKYKVSLDDLLDINDLELESDAQIGDIIVIPTQVTLPAPTAPKKFITTNTNQVKLTQATAPANLGAGSLVFIWPTSTRSITQGFSSRHSGIDISDSKKEAIYASESGFVEISGFQSNGYGNTIVINHGNGFKTRYGHASELYVKAGEYVEKGQTIAKQGNTGRVRGVTGIHLHFEITKNGVHVNPLNYVRP
ncbi:MAG: M23 family metallopeptidase [Candidatus Doudnabacteria bacterium]|nr:M23 family metallopeptidase [Candidatus Doudnabacteria bacterium]